MQRLKKMTIGTNSNGTTAGVAGVAGDAEKDNKPRELNF